MQATTPHASITPVLSAGERYLKDASPEQLTALRTLAKFVQVPQSYYASQNGITSNGYGGLQSVGEFSSRNFYIPETEGPMQLMPHQEAILNYIFSPNNLGRFTTVVYSTVKKSGKTAIASLVARWAAETWGRFNEILCVANDYEQAKGRVYAKFLQSIELDPNYDKGKKVLPGRWDIVNRQATHIPS